MSGADSGALGLGAVEEADVAEQAAADRTLEGGVGVEPREASAPLCF